MSEPSPLVFNGEPEEEWQDWMQEHYLQRELDGKKVPHYILIAGDPDQVPFHFQTLLDSAASAGRVDFDSIGDLETYIDKVLRYERASDPTAAREALFFATDGGPGDATHFSRRFMADPLAKHVRRRDDFRRVPSSRRTRPRQGFSTRRDGEHRRWSTLRRTAWPRLRSGWTSRNASMVDSAAGTKQVTRTKTG